MTKKEEEPRNSGKTGNQQQRDLSFNPDITPEDKEVLNNQSQDEQKGNYFKEREEPIDYEGEELDIPDIDQKKFNETKSEADDSVKQERPKESANSPGQEGPEGDTIYKGKKAEKYHDPSEKSRPKD